MTTQLMAGQTMPMMYADPAAVAAAETAKAEVQAAFVMAMQRPRNAEQARADILKLCRKPDFAEAVEYSKPIGGSRVTGLSVRFAEQALRLWRNVKTTQRVVYEDENVRRVRVDVLDLEVNAGFSKEISINKTVERSNSKGREVVGERTNTSGNKVFIVKATEDELAIKESASVSKIIRNEGLRLLPYDIKEEAIATARATLKARDAQDPDAARRKITDAFAGIGVTVVMLEDYLKHPVDQSAPAEIEELRKMYQSITAGEARWADFMAPIEPEKPAGNAADLTRAAMDAAKKKPVTVAPPPGTWECPDTGTDVGISDCEKCTRREGCPAFDEPETNG